MIKCPHCGEELEARFNRFQEKDADYVEILLDCKNGHQYFVRIKEDDLLEE